MSPTGFVCIAHRGASGHAPENTLLAVRKALAMGASWIEVDVHLAAGELMVIHDGRLERTTNGMGEISEKDLGYLRSLDAGNGEKIPFLREVLDLVAGRAGLNIELKGAHTAGPVAALLRARLSASRLRCEQVIVSSFDQERLLTFKREAPAIPIGVLYGKIPRGYGETAEQMGAYSVHVSKRAVSERFIADIHHRGMKVFSYTVNRPEAALRLRRMGVDGIFTDFPELCVDMKGDLRCREP